MPNVSQLADQRAKKQGVVKAASVLTKAPRFSLTACTSRDIEECTEMGEQMHNESAYANIPYSSQTVRDMLEHVIHNEEVYKTIVARDMDKQLIGMSLVYQSPYYFAAHEFAVYDRCIYVTPAWRGSSLFVRMLALLIEWAKGIGASEFVIGTTTKVGTEQYEDILLRLGLERVGGVYKFNMR